MNIKRIEHLTPRGLSNVTVLFKIDRRVEYVMGPARNRPRWLVTPAEARTHLDIIRKQFPAGSVTTHVIFDNKRGVSDGSL